MYLMILEDVEVEKLLKASTAGTYIVLLCLLHKEGFTIVTKFHMQVHWLPIDFYVHLQYAQSSSSSKETAVVKKHEKTIIFLSTYT